MDRELAEQIATLTLHAKQFHSFAERIEDACRSSSQINQLVALLAHVNRGLAKYDRLLKSRSFAGLLEAADNRAPDNRQVCKSR